MIPTRIGQQFGGGSFAGVIRIEQSAYAIIVAPKSTQTHKAYDTNANSTFTPQTVNNGRANSNAINDSDHPAARYCCNLIKSGHTDWYLPSRDELDVCYRNLKPTTDNNESGVITTHECNLKKRYGQNNSSIPTCIDYTPTDPCQTTVTKFCAGGKEAFDTNRYYRTSTGGYSETPSYTIIQNFHTGCQDTGYNPYPRYIVRPVRRVLIEQG